MSDETNEGEFEYTRISVKIGEFEVEIEGTQENVLAIIEKSLFPFINELQTVIEGNTLTIVEEIPQVSDVPVSDIETTEYPPPLGRPASLPDALRILMLTSGWGHKPRPLGEILTALETNGLYYASPQISKALVRLVKNSDLRRLGTRGNYRYVVA